MRRRLEGLELEVGVPLLHRDAVGVRLTAAGLVVVERGRALLDSTQSLLSDARATAGEATGIIHVFEPVGMPLSPRVQTLLATHDALPRLRIVVRQVEDPLAHIDEPCELVLHDGPPPDKNTWFSRVLARVPMRALASPDYLRARGTPRSVAELAGHEILGWKRPRERTDVWPLLAGGCVEVCPWFVSHDMLLLRSLASEGGGILVAPHTPMLSEPILGPLVGVLEDEVGCELVFRASSRHHSDADARARDTLKHIQNFLADFPEV